VVEEAASRVMLKRLGPMASAYEEGLPGKLDRAARALSAAGALALAAGGLGPGDPAAPRGRLGLPRRDRNRGRAPHSLSARAMTARSHSITDHRRRVISAAGGALLLAGAVCKRWAVFKAGFASAEDPAQTVSTQRARMVHDGVPGA
jgi:hypothetical protein